MLEPPPTGYDGPNPREVSVMSDHDETTEKKGHKKLFAMLLAAVGGVLFFLKKKKAADEPGWEEAKPPAGEDK